MARRDLGTLTEATAEKALEEEEGDGRVRPLLLVTHQTADLVGVGRAGKQTHLEDPSLPRQHEVAQVVHAERRAALNLLPLDPGAFFLLQLDDRDTRATFHGHGHHGEQTLGTDSALALIENLCQLPGSADEVRRRLGQQPGDEGWGTRLRSRIEFDLERSAAETAGHALLEEVADRLVQRALDVAQYRATAGVLGSQVVPGDLVDDEGLDLDLAEVKHPDLPSLFVERCTVQA